MPSVFNMTKSELLAIPSHNWNDGPVVCDSLIIIPSRSRHDSGYRNIEVVACRNREAICKITATADDLNLDDGRPSPFYGRDKQISVYWRIDCLPNNGLFRIWLSSASGTIIIRSAISSLKIECMDTGVL